MNHFVCIEILFGVLINLKVVYFGSVIVLKILILTLIASLNFGVYV